MEIARDLAEPHLEKSKRGLEKVIGDWVPVPSGAASWPAGAAAREFSEAWLRDIF